MWKNNYRKRKFGFGLIEIIVGSSIMAIVLIAAVTSVNSIKDLNTRTTDIIRANYLLLEGVDALKILRDESWSTNLDPLVRYPNALGTYYFVWTAGTWSLSTTPSLIDGKYTRTVTVGDVYRDVNSNIDLSSVTLDPGTLSATTTVSWSYKGETLTKEFQTYITDLYAN